MSADKKRAKELERENRTKAKLIKVQDQLITELRKTIEIQDEELERIASLEIACGGSDDDEEDRAGGWVSLRSKND